MDAQTSKLEALRIVTRCTDREQFVVMFRRFCSPTSCFIPSPDTRPAGTATAFSIRLAGGAQLLQGQGVVLDAWSTAENPFKRPGVHLGIHHLSEDSAELFQELLADRSAAVRMPPAAQLRLLHETIPHTTAHLETPTIEMPPLPLPEEPRVPGSAFILPANPLTEMTDDLVAAFVECNLTTDLATDFATDFATGAPPTQPLATIEIPAVAADLTPPADSPVVITDAVPVHSPFDPTTPNVTMPYPSSPVPLRAGRDTIPTPSGPPPSGPTPSGPPPSGATPSGSRDMIATLLGMTPLAPPRIYAAPTPVITELVDRVNTRVTLPTVAVAPRRPSAWRLAAARVRRWWIPATVAATLTAVVLWFTLSGA